MVPIAVVIQALGATSPATGAPLQPHIYHFPSSLDHRLNLRIHVLTRS